MPLSRLASFRPRAAIPKMASVYAQATSRGADKESNWLPVDPASFTLMLRLSSSKAAALGGDWRPPRIRPK